MGEVSRGFRVSAGLNDLVTGTLGVETEPPVQLCKGFLGPEGCESQQAGQPTWVLVVPLLTVALFPQSGTRTPILKGEPPSLNSVH